MALAAAAISLAAGCEEEKVMAWDIGNRCRWLSVGLVCACLLVVPGHPILAASPGPSVAVGDVSFPRSVALGGEVLDLVGAGILRWKILFRAYASAFYLPDTTAPDGWQDDVPKCLTIHYFWDISGEKFGPAGEEVLRRMYSSEELAAIRPQLDALNSAYVDIKEGDRYSLVYTPEGGTTLAHNGQPVITLAGKKFARLYFSVWLGTDPVDATLRDELLGRM